MEESIGPDNSCRTDGGFLEFCRKSLRLKEVDVNSYSPLALAYIGDGVYELVIRTKVINSGSRQVNKMHKKSSDLVKAGSQAQMFKVLEKFLTQEEKTVYRRGRNAKSVTVAKNATMIDYRMATGMEALVGYLFLTEQFGRIVELIGIGLDKMEVPD